jgi:peptidase E
VHVQVSALGHSLQECAQTQRIAGCLSKSPSGALLIGRSAGAIASAEKEDGARDEEYNDKGDCRE